MPSLRIPHRLAIGIGESLAGIYFQQEMRRHFGGIARYCGIGHGGHAIGRWIDDDLNIQSLDRSCTMNGTAVVTMADTTGLVANHGVTGSLIDWGTQILTVDSGVQITLTRAATGSGTHDLEFSNHTQDIAALEELPCDELLIFCCQGANDVTSDPDVDYYVGKYNAWMEAMRVAAGAQRVYDVYLLPLHTAPHANAAYYDVGEAGYNIRAAMTARAAASNGRSVIYNGDARARTVDGVHLDTQAEYGLLAAGMKTAMLGLIYP